MVVSRGKVTRGKSEPVKVERQVTGPPDINVEHAPTAAKVTPTKESQPETKLCPALSAPTGDSKEGHSGTKQSNIGHETNKYSEGIPDPKKRSMKTSGITIINQITKLLGL